MERFSGGKVAQKPENCAVSGNLSYSSCYPTITELRDTSSRDRGIGALQYSGYEVIYMMISILLNIILCKTQMKHHYFNVFPTI